MATSINSNAKYPYWYTKDELKEAVTSPYAGIPADECSGTVSIPPMPSMQGPFGVNYCPAIRKTLQTLNIPAVYTISSNLKKVGVTIGGTAYNAADMLCVKEKCDPLSLKNFSALKMHKYHEDNMPPVPTTANMKNYVALLGYYTKICKNNSFCNAGSLHIIPPEIMVAGASDRIMEIIVLIADAIIREKNQNKAELYAAFKASVKSSPECDELIDMLEKQLKKEGFRE